jgi:hypothetical protein
MFNFHGFQADITTEEDFFFYQQYEREMLPDFFRRFLWLKAQAPEVSDEQAITQTIKALCAGQLDSHLVREHPKTLEGLYEEFRKFRRSEVSHYHKLDQQRKVINENESSRSFKYSKGKEGATSFDVARKQVHSIDSDGCGPQKNCDKNFRPPRQENESRPYDPRRDHQQSRGGYFNRGRGRG